MHQHVFIELYLHIHCEQREVDGSIPFVMWSSFADGQPRFKSSSSVVVSRVYSLLAQLVERLTVNQNVAGSSPAQGAKIREVAEWSKALPC